MIRARPCLLRYPARPRRVAPIPPGQNTIKRLRKGRGRTVPANSVSLSRLRHSDLIYFTETAVIDPIILGSIDHAVDLRPALPENAGAYRRSLRGTRRKAAKIAPMAAGPRRTDHRHRDEAALLVLLNARWRIRRLLLRDLPENLEPIMIRT